MKLFLGGDTKECFLAMTEAGDVCGMVEVSLRNIVDGCLTSPVAYIESIYVDPEFRGTGIARQLLVRAEHWCRSKVVRKSELMPSLRIPMPNDFMRKWASKKLIG